MPKITVYEDVVCGQEDRTRLLERAELLLPEPTRGGAYRNRDGDLVTWDAAGDAKAGFRYVVVQTWPDE